MKLLIIFVVIGLFVILSEAAYKPAETGNYVADAVQTLSTGALHIANDLYAKNNTLASVDVKKTINYIIKGVKGDFFKNLFKFKL